MEDLLNKDSREGLLKFMRQYFEYIIFNKPVEKMVAPIISNFVPYKPDYIKEEFMIKWFKYT